ncbi:YbfB/YjiJ family MFS transporter [Stappia sp.]|uniref:YbfB/YjiJ family MFS transporter n=1 Tax=Stappia sp. TaxID=1870903 RepID=UPI0032D97718
MGRTAAQWAVVLGLSLGPAVSNGLARFAYGLVLPAMQADLAWSYTEAGLLNTANAAGYLAGAFMAFGMIDRVGARRLFVLGILTTPLTLLGSAVVDSLALQSLFRIAAGLAGAAVFISGGAMAAMLFRDDRKANALAISLYFGGGGLGMILSGAVIPVLLDGLGDAAWGSAWLFLAALSAIAVAPALWAARRCPEPARVQVAATSRLPLLRMAFSVSGYFLFAVGYIVYLTYLAAMMRGEGASAVLVAATWTLIGLGVIAAPFLWRPVLSRSDGGGALGLACLVTAIATLLPLALENSAPLLVSSAVLFGLSFFMAPTAVTSFARKNLPEASWGRAVALYTTIFALGQIVGPALAGWIADATGSIGQGMAAAGLVLLAGAALSALQRPFRLAPSPTAP